MPKLPRHCNGDVSPARRRRARGFRTRCEIPTASSPVKKDVAAPCLPGPRRLPTRHGRPRMNILLIGSGAREHALAW
ncbi:MAG: hypothetical protein M5U07_23930, partial [Xanthobacteraceae bacterium]|nr:hypothetical protein [Xanthobacteraceae bacterium]